MADKTKNIMDFFGVVEEEPHKQGQYHLTNICPGCGKNDTLYLYLTYNNYCGNICCHACGHRATITEPSMLPDHKGGWKLLDF
jgi:transcription elongation factor Elf1